MSKSVVIVTYRDAPSRPRDTYSNATLTPQEKPGCVIIYNEEEFDGAMCHVRRIIPLDIVREVRHAQEMDPQPRIREKQS